MAAAQLLKVTNTIDNRVGGIADNVLVVGNSMAGVDDRVKDVNDKLVVVIDVAQCIFNQPSKIGQLPTRLDGKEASEVNQRAADGVDRMERSWFPNHFHSGHAGSIILTGNQLLQDLRRWL